MKILLPFFLLVLFSVQSFAADSTLSITPSTFITESEQAVMFSLALDCQTTCPESIELVQWKDETQKESKARYQLLDNGKYGDVQAGDHIYSRQTYIKQNIPKTLYFTAANDKQGQIKVIARPTFVELVKNAFAKLSKAW